MVIVDVPELNEKLVITLNVMVGCPVTNNTDEAFKFNTRMFELLEKRVPIFTE